MLLVALPQKHWLNCQVNLTLFLEAVHCPMGYISKLSIHALHIDFCVFQGVILTCFSHASNMVPSMSL